MNAAAKPRVAFCIDSFRVGGTELNAVRTAEALCARGVPLVVFHFQHTGPLRGRYEAAGIPLVHVAIPNLYSWRSLRAGAGLARALREWRADVLHAHDIYSNIFAVPWARVATGVKTIASRRWWYEAPRPELLTANRWSYRFAHKVLANSHGVAGLLTAGERVPSAKVVEVPNFVGEEAFERVDASARRAQRELWSVPEGHCAVGVLARLSPVKNHVLLLRALALLDDRFHAVLIGDGPSRAEIEQCGRELGVSARIHFAGELLSPLNLHQFFDISVLCSRSEGFPNSLLEAMAAARPVVATPVGGVPDLLEDGRTGVFVSTTDPQQLASALSELWGDAARRLRIAAAGEAVAYTRYHRSAVIDRLEQVYASLAELRD